MPVRTSVRRLGVEFLEAREVLSTAMPHHVLDVHQDNLPAKYQTIQSAINAAQPGDEVRVFGGTYREAVTVSTPNLTIDGAPGARVVIDNPGGAANGITVSPKGHAPLAGFTLANVTVSDFKAYGVYLVNVSGFTLSHVTTTNNATDGVYAVLSAHGKIDACTASGSNDIGLYVGQSNDVSIRNSVAFNNVNGIEVENASNIRIVNNTVFGNTVGIVLDQLPAILDAVPGFTPVQASANNVVESNLVFANNRTNTAEPDDLAALEQPGTGILLIGGDHGRVRYNQVFANAYAGIVLLAGSDVLALAPGTPGYSAGFDGVPRNMLIADNRLFLNGFLAAPPGYPASADLIWTGAGSNIHFSHNHYSTSTPGTLP
jgi:parallel beta-helix repeat protein